MYKWQVSVDGKEETSLETRPEKSLETRLETRLVAWAAAAVLKSLASSHVLHSSIIKSGSIPVLTRLATSSCTLEAQTADMALKRLMAVAVTRESFAPSDTHAIATWSLPAPPSFSSQCCLLWQLFGGGVVSARVPFARPKSDCACAIFISVCAGRRGGQAPHSSALF